MPLFVDTFLAGEALGDGDALGDAEALEAWALELGPPGRRLVGRFTEGELEPGSPRPPGDFDLVLGDPGTESELGVCEGVTVCLGPGEGQQSGPGLLGPSSSHPSSRGVMRRGRGEEML